MATEEGMTFEAFAEKLLEEKGVGTLPNEVKAEMRADLIERLSERLNTEMVVLLPPKNVEALNELLEKKVDDSEIRDFFAEQIPDYPLVFARVLMSFRATYLG